MPDKKSLEALQIQPVGEGLIDLICPPEHINAFIDFCEADGVPIRGFTWWCHVTEGHAPCGMGGPRSRYYDGWFSEIPMEDIIRLPDNGAYRDFFRNTWPKDKSWRDCWWPGFWLEE